MIPESFFTWEQLATYGGATVATMLFVQFTKGLPGIVKIPTRLWAFIVAAFLMILATVFTSPEVTPAVILITVVNAVIVAMASCGEYDTLHSLRKAE